MHKEHDNLMAPRTTGALAMRPTRNSQGSHYFFLLSTDCIIGRNRATRLPMPKEVINLVHLMAKDEQMQQGLEFANGEGIIPDNNANDTSFDSNGSSSYSDNVLYRSDKDKIDSDSDHEDDDEEPGDNSNDEGDGGE